MSSIKYLVLFIFSLFTIVGAQSSNLSALSYSSAYASQSINQTLAYINNVNQSGYLIFYPNLTKAYAYLGQAQAVQNKSPSTAVLYANQAYIEAQNQYGQIGTHRIISLVIMLILSAFALLWLYLIIKKPRSKK